jgi:osmotically-inducible protein OsmY
MRLIRRVLLLGVVGVAAVGAYVYWSGNGPRLRDKVVDLAAETAKREAGKVASGVAEKAGDAAGTVGHTIKDGTLTAKIKSKMALDDHVKARAIDVDTTDSVATLSGVVASKDERKRAVQLARDTEGITRVVDKLEVKSQ